MNRITTSITFLAVLLVYSTGEPVTPNQSEYIHIMKRFGNLLNGEIIPDESLPSISLIRQDYEYLEINRSVLKTPLRIGSKSFHRGLGTHATSHIKVHLPEGAERFTTKAGIDNNHDTQGLRGSVRFMVAAGGKAGEWTPVLRGGDEPFDIDVPVAGADIIELHVNNGGDNDAYDQANWADAAIITKEGKKMWLDEMPLMTEEWLGKGLPFSFIYDGKKSSEVIKDWKSRRKSERIDDARTLHTTYYEDEKNGLEITFEATEYSDFPAVEWVMYFRNNGNADTPVIENIFPLDINLQRAGGKAPLIVHGARGGVCQPTDYEPLRFVLEHQKGAQLRSTGGRSSNGNLPFFNVDAGSKGIIIGIGWSGEWSADFTHTENNEVNLKAGMPKTHLLLHPGEKIRSPRILIISWTNDRYRGHNMLRQLIYRHKTPLLSGKKPLPPVQCNTWFPVGDDGGKASAENQIELLKAYAPLGIEYLVMDAGWYGTSPTWWENVGTWTPRKDTFPDGLKSVGKASLETGIKFGMWFEPERVIEGTQLDRERPEWLIKHEGERNRLLNLGIPEVRKWFVEMVSGYVREVPLGYFRHDFNMDPLPYWQSADSPDRIGMTEIRYIEGLYEILDELHRTFPDLMMEGCASGGRRIDLESIRYSHTYWKTDLYGNITANQGHTYGASLYLPGNYLNTPLFCIEENPYAFRSQLGCALCLGWDPRQKDFNHQRAIGKIREFKRLREFATGDFYPLTEYSLEPSLWIGYQFHRDDLDAGMALLFRREKSQYTGIQINLRGLSPETLYELTFEDTGEKKIAGGDELMQLRVFNIPKSPGSVLITYKALESKDLR